MELGFWRALPAGKERLKGVYGEDMGTDWLVSDLLFPLPSLKILFREYLDAVLGHKGGFVTQGIVVSVEQTVFSIFYSHFLQMQIKMFCSPGASELKSDQEGL